MSTHTPSTILKRADPTTIQDKFLVGYQGWYTCPGDGEPVGPGHHGWLHWFNQPIPSGGHPNIDLWPDVSSYSPSELFSGPGLKTKSGEPVFLFSSRHPKTVQRHFHWMAEHGIDGVFLQRFASECDVEAGNEGIRRIRDEVGDRVLEAAEKEGRVFAIMYDVTGVPADRVHRVLAQDWTHLMHSKKILDSPNYLRENGRPVVGLWGFGFAGSGHTPAMLRSITHFFRFNTPGGNGGVYLVGGTPNHWRTADGDADADPGFREVWLREFDAIMPWTVGRYKDEDEGGEEGDGQRARERRVEEDVKAITKWVSALEDRRRIDYVPVVYPGGSGFNMSDGKWSLNDIKRQGGRFLWTQIVHAQRMGVRFIYGAMWDEYDEGTALMPVVSSKRLLPSSDYFPFMSLDVDGYDLPSDWYMRICGLAAEGLRKERRIHDSFPSKELQDYWSTRPRHQIIDERTNKMDFVSGGSVSESSSLPESGARERGEESSGSGTGQQGEGAGRDGQTYEGWLATQREEREDQPPPPYSLEAEDISVNVGQAQTQSAAVAAPAHGSISLSNLEPGLSTAALPSVPTVSTPAPAPVASRGNSHPTPAPMPNHPMPNQASGLPSPPVNITARPRPQQQQSYGVNTPAADPHAFYSYSPGEPHSHAFPRQQGQGPVNALASDFRRHNISDTQPQTPIQALRPGRTQVSPPPLHPAHPAATSGPASGTSYNYNQRPHTSHARPPPSNLRLPSPQPHPPSHSSPGSPSLISHNMSGPAQPAKTRTSRPGHSTPAEWGPGPSSGPQQHTQQSVSGGNAGAHMMRPHINTMVGTPYPVPSSQVSPSSSPSLSRPSAGRPTHDQSQSQPQNTGASGNANFGRPYPSPSPSPGHVHHSHASGRVSPYPGRGPSPSPHGHGAPSFPGGPGSGASSYLEATMSPYPGQNTSSYLGQSTTPYPGQNASSYSGKASYMQQPAHGCGQSYLNSPVHTSPPHSPSGQKTFPTPGPSPYPGKPYNPPYPDQGTNINQGKPGGFYIPQAQGTEYLNMPQPHAHTPSNPSNHSSYSPSYIGQPSSTAPYQSPPRHQASFPSPNTGASGGWYSESSSYPVQLPMPPRTPTSTSFGVSMTFPTASTGGGAFGLALSAVDKVAGKKKRAQLESGVESLAQCE
ncbi:hypothetical protein L208DRAFT_1432071 [Tricholoma matsutake]|nr:hypothetical protein L208DRAFT_1432071 [Tricholoma matsutake 945]